MVVVNYNSYNVPNIYGKYTLAEDEKTATFTCTFLIKSDTAANLVAACNTAKAALTEINKDFSFTFDGTAEIAYSHSSNTGFLSRPRLTVLNNELSTGTSRPYSFTVQIQLPFDQTGYSYRREASFTVNYSPNRGRTVSFKMVYTAGGSNSALDNYLAGTGGKNWASTIPIPTLQPLK